MKVHDLILDRLDLILPVMTGAASGTAYQFKRQKRSRLGHQVVICKFTESLLNNTELPASGEDGRENIRILEEICKQIRQPAPF